MLTDPDRDEDRDFFAQVRMADVMLQDRRPLELVGFNAGVDRHSRTRMTLGDVIFVPAFRESGDPAKYWLLGIRGRELITTDELHFPQYGWSAIETKHIL